ncbi:MULTISPECIES: hypothetical protein [Streptomyces]|uniref:Uncharacterized protein n=1 Tax=Streptomyces ramulosus TaxID=47762 RepID=A0ABW1FPI8_9ACTN
MLEEALRRQAAALDDEFADHDAEAFTQRLVARITDSGSRPPERVGRQAANGARPIPVRPAPPRRRRRRPTPILESAVTPAETLAEVRTICDLVLNSDALASLHAFRDDYDPVGARTFACLLYYLRNWEAALFWWRFAAGAGDELAAYLLFVHHAAVGPWAEARVWRATAMMMGFNRATHLPTPVTRPCERSHPDTRSLEQAFKEFVDRHFLPNGLVAN